MNTPLLIFRICIVRILIDFLQQASNIFLDNREKDNH